jgi:hypothetical protein
MAEDELDYDKLTKQALREDHEHLAASQPPAMTVEQKAEALRDIAPAGYLYGALSGLLGPAMDVDAFKAFHSAFLNETKPADAIERMWLEQLLLAHNVIGRLHVRAGTRENNIEEVKVFHAAAARLMAEFRRSALALQVYREASAKKASGSQAKAKRIASAALDNGHAGDETATAANSEQGSNARNRLSGYFDALEPALS